MTSQTIRRLASFTYLALCGACASGSPAPSVPEVSEGTTFASQAARGAEVYTGQCAQCHGDSGQGSLGAPPVAGEGALPLVGAAGSQRTDPFHTAADIMTWVRSTMPPAAPGSLSEQDYWAVMAFALQANGVNPDSPLDLPTANAIVLHE